MVIPSKNQMVAVYEDSFLFNYVKSSIRNWLTLPKNSESEVPIRIDKKNSKYGEEWLLRDVVGGSGSGSGSGLGLRSGLGSGSASGSGSGDKLFFGRFSYNESYFISSTFHECLMKSC